MSMSSLCRVQVRPVVFGVSVAYLDDRAEQRVRVSAKQRVSAAKRNERVD